MPGDPRTSRNGTDFTPSKRVAKRPDYVVVEGVAIAIVVFGPLLTFLVLLFKAIRKLMPQQSVDGQSWKPRGFEQPPSGGDLAGDREPRRPLTPSGSAAVGLALPAGEAWEEDHAPVRRTDLRPGRSDPDYRLAG